MRFKETRQFQLVITTEKTRVGPVGPTESVVTRQLEREREREPLHVYTAAVGLSLRYFFFCFRRLATIRKTLSGLEPSFVAHQSKRTGKTRNKKKYERSAAQRAPHR